MKILTKKAKVQYGSPSDILYIGQEKSFCKESGRHWHGNSRDGYGRIIMLVYEGLLWREIDRYIEKKSKDQYKATHNKLHPIRLAYKLFGLMRASSGIALLYLIISCDQRRFKNSSQGRIRISSSVFLAFESREITMPCA